MNERTPFRDISKTDIYSRGKLIRLNYQQTTDISIFNSCYIIYKYITDY